MGIPFQYDPGGLTLLRATLGLITKSPTVMLYVGPDQIMPITSVLSAIVGVALLFWGRLMVFVGKCWAALTRRGQPPQSEHANKT